MTLDHQESNTPCSWSLYSHVQTFPEALHSDRQGGEDYMTGLVQTSTEATRFRAFFPLIVSRDSYSPWTLARLQIGGAQPGLVDVTWCFDIILITNNICVGTNALTGYEGPSCSVPDLCNRFYDLSAWDGCWSLVSLWKVIYNFVLNVCPFDCKTVAGSGKAVYWNFRLTKPVGWLLSLQLAALSRSVIVV